MLPKPKENTPGNNHGGGGATGENALFRVSGAFGILGMQMPCKRKVVQALAKSW